MKRSSVEAEYQPCQINQGIKLNHIVNHRIFFLVKMKNNKIIKNIREVVIHNSSIVASIFNTMANDTPIRS